LKSLKEESSKLSEIRKQSGSNSHKVLDFRTEKPLKDINEFKLANGKIT